MDLNVSFSGWESFFLVFVRTAALIGVAPVLGARPIPTQVKIGLAGLLALILAPLHATGNPDFSNWLSMFFAVAGEVLIGLLMGFSAALAYSAIRMTAHLVAVQIGFGMPGTIDPMATDNSGFLDTFYDMVAVVVFLGMGGHYALIAALSHSLDVVSLGSFGLAAISADKLIYLASATLAGAVRLAMPAVGTLLVTDASMALVARMMPQMNIFAVGLPVKMVVGVATLVALVPATVAGMASVGHNVSAAIGSMLP